MLPSRCAPAFLALALSVAAAPSAFAQAEDVDGASEGGGNGKKKKKKKKKKKAQPAPSSSPTPTPAPAPAPETTAPPAPAGGAGATKPPPGASSSSRLLPKWPRRGFDWDVQPILAYKTAVTTSEGTTTRTAGAETGLRAGLTDVPIVPGNPGAGLGARAGVAIGDVASVTTDDASDAKVKSNAKSTRVFGGVSVTGYYKFVKQELGLERAKITYDYDKEKSSVVQQLGVDHDLGLLVLPWLSAHHTLSYSRAFFDQASEPFLVSQDHWLHTRIFTDFLQFAFDLGPGLTFADEFGYDAAGAHEKTATGRTDYFQMLTRFHLFWKLGASGRAKYIYASTEEALGSYAGLRLPGDDLDQPSSVSQPEDSFLGSFFLGVSDLFYGIGVGYRYNVEILNLSEKDGKKKSVTKDSGFGAAFEASI